MWKELKQKREAKKQSMQEDFRAWKENIKDKYGKRFPKPKLDKPTDHLISVNQTSITAESTKSTRLIFKFWLI